MKSSLHDWINKKIRPALPCGRLLEIGPDELGTGLEIIKGNHHLDLTRIGYSTTQQQAASEQANLQGLYHQVTCLPMTSNLADLPDHSIDAIVSFGALHAWAKPARVLDEISRLLKHQGLYFIGDYRMDQHIFLKWINFNQDQKLKKLYQVRKSGFTVSAVRDLVLVTKLEQAKIKVQGPDLWITNIG